MNISRQSNTFSINEIDFSFHEFCQKEIDIDLCTWLLFTAPIYLLGNTHLEIDNET